MQINYVDEQFGLPTIRDVLRELEKPGRDPDPNLKQHNLKKVLKTLTICMKA